LATKTYIDRPPRIEPELPSGIHEVPNPPETEEKPGEALAQAFLPMVMIFGYILVSVLGGGQSRNMFMMIPMALSVVASVAVAFYSRAQDKKMREEMADAYKRRISELRREMESKQEQQRIYYFHNYPNPETTLAIAQDISQAIANREEDIRSGTRLWERRPTDHDFLHLRLGISSRPSTVLYNISTDARGCAPGGRFSFAARCAGHFSLEPCN
jgi:S-DNA-T family DNA segregation ATPase FtsK/SpoIIIE